MNSLLRSMGGLALAAIVIVGARFVIEHRASFSSESASSGLSARGTKPLVEAHKDEKNNVNLTGYHGGDDAPTVATSPKSEPVVPADEAVPAPLPPAKSAPVVAPIVAEAKVVVEAPRVVVESPKTEPAPVASANAPPVSAPLATGQQSLDLEVASPVRIKLDLDSGSADVKELKPDTYHLTFNDSANLLIYDAAALTIRYNGQPLGDLGAKGRIRRLSFRAHKPKDSPSL